MQKPLENVEELYDLAAYLLTMQARIFELETFIETHGLEVPE